MDFSSMATEEKRQFENLVDFIFSEDKIDTLRTGPVPTIQRSTLPK
jgi:hypothetical protein